MYAEWLQIFLLPEIFVVLLGCVCSQKYLLHAPVSHPHPVGEECSLRIAFEDSYMKRGSGVWEWGMWPIGEGIGNSGKKSLLNIFQV